jgi:hypothetical protein
VSKSGILLCVICIVGGITVGFLLSPKYDISETDRVEAEKLQLEKRVVDLQETLKHVDDSVNYYKERALAYYKTSKEAQKIKVIYRNRYVQDTTYNRNTTLLQRDSIIRSVFLKK